MSKIQSALAFEMPNWNSAFRWTLLFLLLLPALAVAQTTAVEIVDGDSLIIATPDLTRTTIKLAGIDAPEPNQPFGMSAKRSLSDICHRRLVALTDVRRDRFGRTVARVHCVGVDASAEQVRRGMAWMNIREGRDQALQDLQDEARAAGRGLWAEPNPTAPWDWRRDGRKTVIRKN